MNVRTKYDVGDIVKNGFSGKIYQIIAIKIIGRNNTVGYIVDSEDDNTVEYYEWQLEAVCSNVEWPGMKESIKALGNNNE